MQTGRTPNLTHPPKPKVETQSYLKAAAKRDSVAAYKPNNIDILRASFLAWQVSLTMKPVSNGDASRPDLRWTVLLDHPGRAPRRFDPKDASSAAGKEVGEGLLGVAVTP